MKKIVISLLAIGGLFLFAEEAEAAGAATMYRMYNPNSGEHFYTGNTFERDGLFVKGWNYEDVAWYIDSDAGGEVYRLYNPNNGDHHYTLDINEVAHLEKVGWKYEGLCWYSDLNEAIPIYRVYNPKAKVGSHHYTADLNEVKQLVKAGWKDEGIGWYAYALDNSKGLVPAEIRGTYEGRTNDKQPLRLCFAKNEVLTNDTSVKVESVNFANGGYYIAWDVAEYEARYNETLLGPQALSLRAEGDHYIYFGNYTVYKK
ncbi:hypothetical protein M2139_002036 [Enterococcus sp. PF1-24]|uniref:hypothetical protein n=1 Tax=unclassified Enterococcus TaxID=2608891 RepID=UPI002473D50C|nr:MULTISPECIES: hypothetical protein [unclassified Enterococcus]MDH6365091.1 hypothetical protein [Enterococcus sp. PFB1-1]MDH6402136.1 hypothetical protein [Enterococcus sp. PF1-24]